MDFLKGMFAGNKTRLKINNYNLDLTYITPRIIAMSYPSNKLIQKIYRNDIDEVSHYLNEKHSNNYYIFNLSGIPYNTSKFHGTIETFKCDDHQPPPLDQIFVICKRAESFLEENDNNVVIFHCLCGKGRTGTVIGCFLLYSGVGSSAQKVIDYFAIKRFKKKGKGVTNTCQVRYIFYVDIILNGMLFPSLSKSLISDINSFTDSQITYNINQENFISFEVINIKEINVMINKFINDYKTKINLQEFERQHEIYDKSIIKIISPNSNNKEKVFAQQQDNIVFGDVRINFYKNKQKSKKQWCRIWFNVSMLFFKIKNQITNEPYSLSTYEKYEHNYNAEKREGCLCFDVGSVDPHTLKEKNKYKNLKIEIKYEHLNQESLSNDKKEIGISQENETNNVLNSLRTSAINLLGNYNKTKNVFYFEENDIEKIISC